MSKEITNNVNGYKSLLEIEIGLREYIVDSFNKGFSSNKWIDDPNGPLSLFRMTTSNPNEKKTFYDKVLEQRKYSADTGWNPDQAREIHGLYFLLFTDLKLILESKKFKNSKGESLDAFQLGDRQIKAITSGMEALFPIRNKLAHCVFISDLELKVLKSYRDTISNMIDDFDFFINKSFQRENALAQVKFIIPQIINAIINNEAVDDKLSKLSASLEILDIDLDLKIIEAVQIIKTYSRLKKTKGSSVLLRDLIQDNLNLLNSLIR